MPCQERKFPEFGDSVILTAQLGIVKILHATREVNFRFSGGKR